ncbi:MAG: RNA 2',3'-cyclic phosphodiesterase [Anaerolineaceae bacterium]|nr:RNA 2',3'-cyclic phosphodiesterase [Anaerolineaceae bacterium]
MNQKIRLFIAIDLPEVVKGALLSAAVLLGQGGQTGQRLPDGAVRWVKPEQLHLTLRFLGDTAVSQLPILQDQLTRLTAQHPAFHLRQNGLGAFPNRKRPRVVWAGLAGELAALQAMQAELEDRVVALGWPREERPFSPHITLGRVKDVSRAQALNWQVALAELAIEVTAVKLVQSELRPSGPVYTVRHVAYLGRGN